jgi:hypothetical protein
MRSERTSIEGSEDTRPPTLEAELSITNDATEHIHCRNYDHNCGYDVHIVIRQVDSIAFERRIYLQPGSVRSLSDVVPTGTWQVSVSLDESCSRTVVCSIGPTNDQTVVVECGNGAISVTDRDRSGTDTHRQ